ncbi:hypothetical protein AVEN_116107-1 [Araneus ventricosus]|uniref:Tc1-like transposase DDE domain-containing protein n=1 Tax=Araneus ventricosus TaxID=182803 RepID=A0A4Y2VBQ1_ARAVE|nr:hypothetical protein AVEN_116107-1 [Araneus ventricosus]
MDWPAYSPDLNPIEHVCICLADELQLVNPSHLLRYRNLGGHCLDEWCNIPQDQIDNLILSVPRRSVQIGSFGKYVQLRIALGYSCKLYEEVQEKYRKKQNTKCQLLTKRVEEKYVSRGTRLNVL